MYNTFSLTLTHTRDRSSEDCIHTYLGTRCARTRCNATTNAKIKKETKKKTISTSASPLSSIRRRSTKKKKKNATTRNGSGETETSFRTLMESRTRSSKLFTYRLVLDSNRAEVSRSRRRMVRTVFRQYSEFLRTVKLQQLQRHA